MSKATKRRLQDDKSSSNKEGDNKKHKGHWSMGLLSSLEDPELFVLADDLVTVIKDRYPKAERHYLVLPKENISSLKAVSEKHLFLLQHMGDVAKKLCEREDCTSRKFKIGYHAEPSMVRLHLHVISEDMNSPCLKTKKHWNSFYTQFFLESKDVCKQLEENKKIQLPTSQECKEFLNRPLKCNQCSFSPKNMPDLKRHLLVHFKK